MRFYDIIDKKKKGYELDKDEIDFWVNNMVKGKIPDYEISALLMAITLKGMSEQETVWLTQAMANSGETMDLSQFNDASIDKHSTGGVGDSVSFVLLPVLVSAGYIVAKASGRGLGYTGGTLDKLESIDGVSIDISKNAFIKQVQDIGIAIGGQNKELCPADKQLYALRDVTATIDSIPLIASSVMSKKLCCGAKNIILDVKYGCGAFMQDKKQAYELAKLMVKIGNECGRNTKALVTNMNSPLGEWIGNRVEIYGAIEVLKGKQNRLNSVCKALFKSVTGNAEMYDSLITGGKPLEIFFKMLKRQGAKSVDIDAINTKCVKDIFADKDGYVNGINALNMAKIVYKLGGGRDKKDDIINLNVGLHLIAREGDYVHKGDIIAQMLYDHAEHEGLASEVLDAYKIEENKQQIEELIYSEVQ